MALGAEDSGGKSTADLLDRLTGWLDADDSAASEVDRVLRAPWRHLTHQASGTEQVRQTELQRLQNAGSAEERVRSDYRGRYAIELLQNAHDACADAAAVGQAWLRLTPTALLVANQGVPFTAERIDSLLQLGDSSKKADRAEHHTIGYKGIGFSAVLEITDQPQIISASTRFCFHRHAARERVGQVLGSQPRAVPMRYFPFPLDQDDLGEDAAAVEDLVDGGAVTVIRLPLVNPRKAKEVQAELQSGLRPETLLFMPHLQRLTLATRATATRWSRRAGHRIGPGQLQHLREEGGTTRSWLVASRTVALDKAAVAALDDPLWASVRQANVSVGIPWRDGKPDPGRGDQPMHVYFPTDDRLGRPLLVHGDFYVQSNRRRITSAGRGADVSRAIAEAAADLTADLAVALADHGNTLLRTLAPCGPADGFGTVLAQMIDARLRECRILRPADQSGPVAAAGLRRVAADLSQRHLAALVDVLSPRNDILRAGDDAGCEKWLDSLGTGPLPAAVVAERLTPHASTPYEAMLSVVARWHGNLQQHEAFAAKLILQRRPLLQDQDGTWSPPQRLVRLDPRTPPLPAQLARPEYAPPRSKAARDFAAAALAVEVLTPQIALESVLDYVARRPADREAPGVLPFLRALWRSDQAVLRHAERARLERVPIPARIIGSRDDPGHSPAGSVYFGRQWTNSETLERMYRPFQRQEFLAASPPEERVQRQSDRQFWTALGVRDTPRYLPLDEVRSKALNAWKALDAVREARVCPDRHLGSDRAYRGEVLDRLDELLEQDDERALRALARHLCGQAKPLGEPVTVVCQHGSHSRPRGRTAIGFQRWLLTTRPWLPTDGGPTGRRLRLPQDAWTDVPAGAPRTVLPTPTLPVTDPASLDLNTAHRPGVERLEAAMEAVRDAFPRLDEAPSDVQDGAGWLLRKLDGAAAKHGGAARRAAGPLPARQSSAAVWSHSPVIADLPGAEAVPGVAWLAPSPWTGLQRRYQLERASAVVKADVASTAAHPARPLLTRQDRVHLLALLIDRGGEPGRLAFRLGNLDEQRVTSLQVAYRIHGRTWSVEPAYHLGPHLNARGRLQGAELRSLVNLETADLVQLGHVLAQYLAVGESGDLVGQYLIVRDVLLSAHRILPTQIAEAGQALRRYRANEDAAGAPRRNDTDEPAGDAAEGQSDPADEGQPAEDEAPVPPGTGHPAGQQPTDPGEDTGTAGPPAGGAGQITAPPGVSGRDDEGGQRTNGPPAAPAPRRESVRFGAAERRAAGDRAARRASSTQGAPRTGDRPGAGTTGAATSADTGDRRATEKAAEDVAISFLQTRYAAAVERVGDQNLGWDLTATLPDGNRLLVEVKGFAGRSPDFVITRGELRAAKARSEYRVCVVTGVGTTNGEVAWIEDTAALLADDCLDPFQWIVRDWPRCDHDSHPWSDE